MGALNELSFCKVSTTLNVDMKTAGKTTLFTVPADKIFYPVAIVVSDISASLSGGTDYDFGSGANCDTWRQTVDLSSMTTVTTDFMVIRGADVTKYTASEAAETFGVKVITGSTGAATATIDVFGFLGDV